MLVNKLSIKEKKGLVQLFTFMARANGKIAKHEWSLLNRFADEHGLTYDINEEWDLAEVCARFESQSAKVIALQQIIKMALTDGNYSDAEKAMTQS